MLQLFTFLTDPSFQQVKKWHFTVLTFNCLIVNKKSTSSQGCLKDAIVYLNTIFLEFIA